MPEGDSYARAAARISPIVIGREILAVDGVPAIRRAASRIIASSVTGVRTHGKHLLIDLDNGLSIHVWLGMPGTVHVETGGRNQAVGEESPGRPRHDAGSIRMLLTTGAGTVVVRSAPNVEIERTRVIDASLRRLGPDVLAETFDWEAFSERSRRAPADMIVVDFLLDQRVMAGVGNEYKNEILFLEGLHPATPMGELGGEARAALVTRARRLMLPNAGRPGRTTTGRRGRGSESWVFERTGRPCRRCGSAVLSAAIGLPHPRMTYWCPSCQPDPRSRRVAPPE